MRLNNIKNKRFIIESFKEIEREFGNQYSLDSFEHDPMVLDVVSGFLTKPSIVIVQGLVFNLAALLQIFLLEPNS